MARLLRMESEAGIYHVLNRGNYRADIFYSDGTKHAFLKCLEETCERTGWLVHAWCLMSNHYHLAISTPRANLVDGMRWMQGTFALRFNHFRRERGHIFQGRYKSLVVDPDAGLGPLCHYIHLNPVRAHLCAVDTLGVYPWTSIQWLMQAAGRPIWYDPAPALRHAGGLTDSVAERRLYMTYLQWLAEDEPARKQQRFEQMSRGWIVGTGDFAKAIVAEQKELRGQGPRLAIELQAAREAIWQDALDAALLRLRRTREELPIASKSAEWKLAIAAALKSKTTATNPWLSRHLYLGNRHEVGRNVARWLREPEPDLAEKLGMTTHPTA